MFSFSQRIPTTLEVGEYRLDLNVSQNLCLFALYPRGPERMKKPICARRSMTTYA